MTNTAMTNLINSAPNKSGSPRICCGAGSSKQRNPGLQRRDTRRARQRPQCPPPTLNSFVRCVVGKNETRPGIKPGDGHRGFRRINHAWCVGAEPSKLARVIPRSACAPLPVHHLLRAEVSAASLGRYRPTFMLHIHRADGPRTVHGHSHRGPSERCIGVRPAISGRCSGQVPVYCACIQRHLPKLYAARRGDPRWDLLLYLPTGYSPCRCLSSRCQHAGLLGRHAHTARQNKRLPQACIFRRVFSASNHRTDRLSE